MIEGQPLWEPSAERIEASRLFAMMRRCSEAAGRDFSDYAEFHAWTVAEPARFWSAMWDEAAIVGEKGERVLVDGERMPGARFFPDARLNYAENCLRRSGSEDAIVFRGEDKVERRMSFDELNAAVSRLQQALRAAGVTRGDRVAAMLPNMPETIIALLACASIGAIFSSCSPDFGEAGVMDRFGQIEPKVFIACDGYWYDGKQRDVADRLVAVSAKLRPVHTVVVAYLGQAEAVAERVTNGISYDAFVGAHEAQAVTFERLPFDHPLYILFSSGTTGVPKCIVHSAGGALIQHVKEHALHCDLREGDRLFYFTTCGWMMWNWLASGLASGLTLCLFDGSPFAPDGSVLFDYAEAERFTLFGTSAKYIDAVRKSGLRPIETHDLSSLKAMTSTGSPLAPSGFEFVYEAIKHDLQLASISGGTDIVSCFVLGVPIRPVWASEIQGPGLGLAVDVVDEEGRTLERGKGELVCRKPFPVMPVEFWNDPDGKRYHDAYFDRFEGIWCHGDFAEWTEHGGIVIHGRSDATLNPGGVRIGTAEIYNQVEQMPEIAEALCVGQEWKDDVRVILFVVLAEGVTLDDDLTAAVKKKIRSGASPRHVPAKVIAVDAIPRTKSGKITELAVRDVIHGRPVKNKSALANPEALDLYAELSELET
ncbi:acetoacetate--CoA ligase [Pararhizobium mangrovi]|uniref:Acetoacetate--CoA ligase n=1 Tax=Pararhizobium mangrovi TaxID=2590452 RepID=A0A506U3K6_9HYPH|nr:acetoacetate--CoA ligase [Pararhizobium mangrovi]TPW27916.1 acetoacetate--CoA ligase [Pararhizobium mangrovi]